MDKHDLLHEFPEYKDKIHQLKISNSHFRELFNEYDELDHHIYRIKMDIEVVTDEALKELKAHLLHLKDEIYSMLQH
jgi:uncharacterized protein YdcH (DUF465 family)